MKIKVFLNNLKNLQKKQGNVQRECIFTFIPGF